MWAGFSRYQPCIVETGRHGKSHGGVERDHAQIKHPGSGSKLVEQYGRHSADLRQCVGLAEYAGRKLPAPRGGVKQRGDQQDAHVAAKYQHGQGDRYKPFVHEYQKQRAQEQFVCDRIEIGPEHGALTEQAGQCPIQRVREAGSDKQHKAESVLAFEDGGHQKRRQANAQKSKQVRRGPQRVQPDVRDIVHGRRNRLSAGAQNLSKAVFTDKH